MCAAYHFVQAPLMAILPDRVPPLARGRFSAVSGLGVLLGLLAGQFLAARLSASLLTGYATLGAACLAIFTAFALANPGKSNTGEPREAFRARTLAGAFWVNPLRHPDFFWALSSRTLLNLAYYIAAGSYLLYILADYAALGTEGATATIPLLTLAGAIVLSLGYVWLFPVAMVLAALGGLTVLPIRGVR